MNALIIGKTSSLPEYQLALKDFIQRYPESDLTKFANSLLDASHNYKNRLVQLEKTHFSKVVDDEDHYFIAVANSSTLAKDIESIKRLIDAQFANDNLTTGTLDVGEGKSYIVVKTLKNKEEALLFYDTIKGEQTIEDVNFVISKLNFEELYQSKELDTYLQFFESNY